LNHTADFLDKICFFIFSILAQTGYVVQTGQKPETETEVSTLKSLRGALACTQPKTAKHSTWPFKQLGSTVA